MIPIADPAIDESATEDVTDVLSEGRFVAGEEVERFEDGFAEYVGADHAVGTVNGTAALHTALVAAGVEPGDRVVTTPMSFIATANAIRLAGAEPVFADVDPTTLNLDPDAVTEVVRSQPVDALLLVHLYGLPAEMDRFAAIADRHDLTVIEDAAQAHGALYEGEHVGTFGDAGCFSFYPTKNMTTGEGGMVVTDDEEIARRARRFTNHGRTGSYTHVDVGHNYRMPNVAGAIGCSQLEGLPESLAARRDNADRLTEALSDLGIELPPRPSGRTHAFHQYTIKCDHRDELKLDLHEHDVQTGVYYPTPIHRQPAYDGYEQRFPVAERATERVLSLPVHPGVTDDQIDRLTAVVADSVAPREVRVE